MHLDGAKVVRGPAVPGHPKGRAMSASSRAARFGAKLRAERESAGMTLPDVAAVTKIPSRTLESLEAGQFDALPRDVFVRGFLRSYARCVGQGAEPWVEEYTQVMADGREANERSEPEAPPRRADKKVRERRTGASARPAPSAPAPRPRR